MGKKLYKVTCSGVKIGAFAPGEAFVIADDPWQAYKALREVLDKKDIGFHSYREMWKIEFLAEETDSPGAGVALYIV